MCYQTKSVQDNDSGAPLHERTFIDQYDGSKFDVRVFTAEKGVSFDMNKNELESVVLSRSQTEDLIEHLEHLLEVM